MTEPIWMRHIGLCGVELGPGGQGLHAGVDEVWAVYSDMPGMADLYGGRRGERQRRWLNGGTLEGGGPAFSKHHQALFTADTAAALLLLLEDIATDPDVTVGAVRLWYRT